MRKQRFRESTCFARGHAVVNGGTILFHLPAVFNPVDQFLLSEELSSIDFMDTRSLGFPLTQWPLLPSFFCWIFLLLSISECWSTPVRGP